MSDFDYGNARLRAMKSRLLSRRTLESLAEAASVQGLITALTNTAYREAVEAALARSTVELAGMDCLAEALRNDLVATVGRARQFFSGAAAELAALTLRRYDVHNVKTVLRGLARQVVASEILSGMLPVGELSVADLAQLAQSADVRVAIDLLATWRMQAAQPLLALRARGRGGDLEVSAMELALDRWYLCAALRGAREAGEAGRPVVEVLDREADAANILTALRLIGATDTATAVREHFGVDNVGQLFVGPGQIQFAQLTEAAHKASVVEAVNVLADTSYGELLAGAMEAYIASGHLSVFERALSRRRLQRTAKLLARDPLGIGVLLGYVTLKTNEVSNLRTIAQGLMLGDKPDRIRAELMFAN